MKKTGWISGFVAWMAVSFAVQAALIGFNAEDGSSATATVTASVGSDFASAQSDANALGGEYITTAVNRTGDGPSSAAQVVSYSITFPSAGTYDLWARVYVGSGAANDDSFFVGNGLGSKTPGGAGDWQHLNQFADSVGSAYEWVNLSDWVSPYAENGVTYTVPSAGTYTFQIGSREDGFRIDAFAFAASGDSFSDEQLTASVIPPPITVLSRSPAADTTFFSDDFPQSLGAVLVDGVSSVDPDSIELILDGNTLALNTGDVSRVSTTTTVSHVVSSLESGLHSLSLVYEGTSPASGPHTLTWSFMVTVAAEVQVCVIGDSTVKNSSPRVGWGQVIGGHFSNRVGFDNRAIPGRSSKTFLSEGDWAAALATLRSNDYVMIQFGHNDSHNPIYPEATEAFGDFQTNLQHYIDDTRAVGAIPVLVTPMYRRNFDADGTLLSYIVDSTGYTNDLMPYATAMKQVAASNDVTCIDLLTASGELLEDLGNDASMDLLVPGDITHWNETGAHSMAALVTRGMAASDEPLKEDVLHGAMPTTFEPGSTAGTRDAPAVLDSAGSPGDFALAQSNDSATVVYSFSDAEVVGIAAKLFAKDIERVTGLPTGTRTTLARTTGPVVLIGTLGQSPDLDALVSDGAIDVSGIAGGWEQYHIEVVESPWPGVPQALVIAGSDRRGTAYGVFSLSEAMGVSPWYFWADSVPTARSELFVDATPFTSKSPSVRYRGIFINDEDWGLQEWAEKNYESGPGEVHDLGPKTYAAVFELLLRLKANYCWPGMHPSTKAFNYYEDNKLVADRYAIVMGSSHAEPMLRNNVDEWYPFCSANGYSSDWNYAYNQAAVYDYWEQRAMVNGAYENVYSVGKRGIHDSGMVEGSSTSDKAAWLNTIFADQRQILADHVNPDVAQVGQIFVPYKEVLDIYDSGLVTVPNDVTLVWPDDNHGYIRRLSDPVEQLRSGGGGIYYHISYWGDPRIPTGEQSDYLWMCSTPPALIWEELTKAYAYNCGRLWVINVGDIKPAEIGMEFSMRLAWDVNRYDENAQRTFLTEWAAREFGSAHADDIAQVLSEFYRLGYERKPEHMMWKDWDDLSPAGPYPMFSHVHYGDEAGKRLDEYAALVQDAQAIYSALPVDQQSAFYETVLYPVLGADGMNRKFLDAGKATVASMQGRNTVAARKAASQAGYNEIQTQTAVYNSMEGGKWNEMMDAAPRGLSVFNMPSLPSDPTLSAGELGVAIEGLMQPAYISADGVTQADPPTAIEINAATEYTALYSPMAVATIDGKLAVYTPGSVTGAQGPSTAAGAAVYTFNVPSAGIYQLAFEVNCPTVNDDSWYIQMDGGSAVTWNGLDNGGVWGWLTFDDVSLTAGSHSLTVYRREDGAAMASIRLQEATETVLVEDQATAGFELPEFNARTRRSFFIDLFNTGSGSVDWQITPADSWVQVSDLSGSVSSEQRVWVSIDWPAAPTGDAIASSLSVESAGQTLVIPVTGWNPADPIPLDVEFVEDNGVVAIEAENYSDQISAADAAWSPLPQLGQGGGSMMVSPTTAASRETLAEITHSSPALVYDTWLRSSGAVSVNARFIPTLQINGLRGLRYAVSFDGQEPQIVDMNRTSGSGSIWDRSVLRAHIDFSSHHIIASPGLHQLKIWMVDPGVVLDRVEIQTDDVPYTYRGAPETSVESFGAYRIDGGESVRLSPDNTLQFDSITNNGTLMLSGAAALNLGSGSFVNNGVLDILSWQGTLPAGFVNAGSVIDSLRIVRAEPRAAMLEVEIPGYAGHGFQLQSIVSDLEHGTWEDVGDPVDGVGTPIVFNAEMSSATSAYYRVVVEP